MPDEETLALWLDDELTGDALAKVEAWAQAQPEQLATRAEVRRWRKTVAQVMPASEEPPYPDFFNTKIQQAIRANAPTPVGAPAAAKRSPFWKTFLMPVAACAGMAFTFWIGQKSHQAASSPEIAEVPPRAIPVVEPVVYTPENGVKAEWFASKEASASVIVLNGVAAIPDKTDFSKTVYLTTERDIDTTAQADDLTEEEAETAQ